MKEKKEKKQQDRQDKHFKIPLPKLPKGLKIFLGLLAVAVFSALVIFFGYHVSYKYWIHQIGDGAYKYSDSTYQLIEDTISKCMIQEAGPDIRTLQKFLDNPEAFVESKAANDQEVSGEVAETVGGQETSGEATEAVGTQESKIVGKYTSSYENGQTKLVCSLQDGYFNAEVTVFLDSDFTILSNSRNFNSLEEYINSYWNDLESRILISTMCIFGIVAVVTFAFFGSTILIYTRVKAKKEKKASSATNSQDASAANAIASSGAPVP